MLKSINTLQIERTMIRMEMKTEILPASDEKSIEKAAALLQNGELVALPTETVYGIAADARNGEAVKKIFVAKGRPQDNPLIVHVTGPEMLPGLVSEVPERAQLLMAAFCPGPLTIIMPRGPEVAAECCAGLDTVGIRMPSHPVARAVIEKSGCAFAAPSANLSGKPSPTNAQDVFTDMDGRLPLILDGGECDVGEKALWCRWWAKSPPCSVRATSRWKTSSVPSAKRWKCPKPSSKSCRRVLWCAAPA